MKRCAQCSFAFEHSGWTCPSCGAEPAMIDGFQAFAPDLAHQNDGFHAHLYTELAALEDSHFWFQSRNELIIWALCQTCPHLRTMMDLQCWIKIRGGPRSTGRIHPDGCAQ